jgi:hypothetical protein
MAREESSGELSPVAATCWYVILLVPPLEGLYELIIGTSLRRKVSHEFVQHCWRKGHQLKARFDEKQM